MAAPNILLIMTDQHALHAVGCYGDTQCQTPNIDALAADGVRFTRAYTPTSLCSPARTSLLCGLLPHNHGVTYNADYMPFSVQQMGMNRELYSTHLAEQGYRLGWSGKWHVGLANLPQDIGFEGFSIPGYGDFWHCAEYDEFLAEKGLEKPRRVREFTSRGELDDLEFKDASGYVEGPAEACPSRLVADRAIELIEKYAEGDEPFFLNCNIWEPHAPYQPSDEYRDMYDPATIEPWANYMDDLADKPMMYRIHLESFCPRAAGANWADWAQAIARYWESATMADMEIGRVIDALKASGKYDDTMVIFTSDHGETVGIHGGAFDKGAMAYEELYHIPMIVKLPGSEHAGETRDQLVSLLDLTETFCETAGTNMERTDGRSLLPILADNAAPWREHLVCEDHGHRIPYGVRMIWWERWKYVLNGGDIDMLYDLEADPHEMHNLIRDEAHAEVLAELRRRMIEHLAETDDTDWFWEMLLSAPAAY
jgi:choline-sulfatase